MRSGIIASSYMRGEPFVMAISHVGGNFSFDLYFIGTIKIDWGDGEVTRVSSNNSNTVRQFIHTYSEAITTNIRIIGSLNKIVRISARGGIPSGTAVTVPYSEFNKLKNIRAIVLNQNYYTYTGQLEEIILPSLQILNIKLNGSINTQNTSLTEILNAGTSGVLEQISDTFINLKTISLYDYNGEIPNIETLESITIARNNTTATLPSAEDCPNIKVISIAGQSTISLVPEYPELENLNLNTNFNDIPYLPVFPKLLSLLIRRYSGNTIPEYPLVNTFVISNSDLTSLSGNFSNIGATGGAGNGSFQLLNNNGLVWDLSNFQGNPGIFNLFNTGGNVTYSGGMNFRSIITTFQINANLSSLEVDLLFNDLDTSGTTPQNSGVSYIRVLGEAATPTSASATARANLTARGFVVSHN